MAIDYRDTRQKEVEWPTSGPILVAIAAITGLMWLGPQSAAMFQHAIAMLRLPL